MLSAARFAPFARIQVRPVLALLVPATAALAVVLAAQPAPAATSVTAQDVTVTTPATDSDNGFSWG
ncbi:MULTISPECIES: hypothetical protein [unclassified Streptomyces]|uniref:hypothetical protein n=1 Tax=unclassified Streptomyces TaxID=2593676 RepID=UPI0006F87E1C|nr:MULTISPECIES: hypothetical protein [unclassified Streptomyces]KQX53975.1 hypothetical protein ASD33_32985 [Streptomyces sp. Root1304]KRA88549.1 hypothetical protein ASE09_32775 [Streptomyces sp. Root66D1]